MCLVDVPFFWPNCSNKNCMCQYIKKNPHLIILHVSSYSQIMNFRCFLQMRLIFILQEQAWTLCHSLAVIKYCPETTMHTAAHFCQGERKCMLLLQSLDVVCLNSGRKKIRNQTGKESCGRLFVSWLQCYIVLHILYYSEVKIGTAVIVTVCFQSCSTIQVLAIYWESSIIYASAVPFLIAWHLFSIEWKDIVEITGAKLLFYFAP